MACCTHPDMLLANHTHLGMVHSWYPVSSIPKPYMLQTTHSQGCIWGCILGGPFGVCRVTYHRMHRCVCIIIIITTTIMMIIIVCVYSLQHDYSNYHYPSSGRCTPTHKGGICAYGEIGTFTVPERLKHGLYFDRSQGVDAPVLRGV